MANSVIQVLVTQSIFQQLRSVGVIRADGFLQPTKLILERVQFINIGERSQRQNLLTSLGLSR